jgi:hypothetical protein
VSTYLGPGGIDERAQEIRVESTEGFPESGVLELAGNHALFPHELVEYERKTEKGFVNCKRGVDGSEASSHWGEARVWCQSANRFTDTIPPTGRQYYHAVRAREHSGLQSAYSRITPSPACVEQ